MGHRTQYFCDWCQADSPLIGITPHGWKRHRDVTTGADELICEGCVEAATRAVTNAKKERRPPQATDTKENDK